MVNLVKKVIANQTYYYLVHTIRKDRKIEKLERIEKEEGISFKNIAELRRIIEG